MLHDIMEVLFSENSDECANFLNAIVDDMPTTSENYRNLENININTTTQNFSSIDVRCNETFQQSISENECDNKNYKRRKHSENDSNPNTYTDEGSCNFLKNKVGYNDSIKMFVGQIPKSYENEDIKAMVENYGGVQEIHILREKATSQSKGCCFVTFENRRSALEFQLAWHNIKSLPGMRHAVQIKPANELSKNDRKLFIGNLDKSLGEDDVKKYFSECGEIEECIILRGVNNDSKGCAFVIYSNNKEANAAITKFNRSFLKSTQLPLLVKLADSKHAKELKRIKRNISPVGRSTIYNDNKNLEFLSDKLTKNSEKNYLQPSRIYGPYASHINAINLLKPSTDFHTNISNAILHDKSNLFCLDSEKYKIGEDYHINKLLDLLKIPETRTYHQNDLIDIVKDLILGKDRMLNDRFYHSSRNSSQNDLKNLLIRKLLNSIIGPEEQVRKSYGTNIDDLFEIISRKFDNHNEQHPSKLSDNISRQNRQTEV
ncbi:uncharacterized protein LOC135926497 isoform X2 [Gordionus sp. m RMFG-2023]|uniref:uncharacterized protein LOC135926497 isoform X2 n=1 Tax=Gordionus sp. m RMFG-2023 TaxID=3053472 RepID=UPI0031FC4E02